MGRTVVVAFEHGDDFFPALRQACRDHGIRSGYIPVFVAAFAAVDLVGTCERPADPQAPIWSKVQLSKAEVLGSGTIAWDEAAGDIAPHLHVAVGLRELGATGYTSHLLGATVQFLAEMVIVELEEPVLHRQQAAELYNVPLLRFGPTGDAARPA